MSISLVRDLRNDTQTLGVLTYSGLTLQTLELPWVPDPSGAVCGTPGASCVPDGVYGLALHDTPRHPRCFALVNPELLVFHEPADVPAGVAVYRVACLIHVANYVTQLLGCIGVGRGRARLGDGSWEITQSGLALGDLAEAVTWKPGHFLTITSGG